MEAIENLRKGEKATLVSMSVSAFLAVIKAIAGLLSGSVVLITSALDSFSDLVGMLASWFGFRISRRKPDEKFPYGYYKAESIATLFVSLLIIYAAYGLFTEGFSRFFQTPEISMPLVALPVAFVSILISHGLSRYLLRVGKRINSELLVTTSKERMTDVAATSAVFVAVATSYMNIMYVESTVSMIISLLILKVGIFSAKDAIFALMDMSPSREKERHVSSLIKGVKDVEEFENLKLRKSGPFIFGEVTIKIKESANVERAHEIADDIENKIKKDVSSVVSFTVHVEPYKSERHKIAVPVKSDKGLDSVVTENFGRAEYFMFVDVDQKAIKKFYSRKNPFMKKSKKAGLSAVHYIIKERADVLLTRKIGEIAFHTLRDHLVDIYSTRGKTAKEVLDKFMHEKLMRLNDHTRSKGKV